MLGCNELFSHLLGLLSATFLQPDPPQSWERKPLPSKGYHYARPPSFLTSEKLRKQQDCPGRPSPQPLQPLLFPATSPATPHGLGSHRARRPLLDASLGTCSSLVITLSNPRSSGTELRLRAPRGNTWGTDPNGGEEGKWKFVKKRLAVAVVVVLEVWQVACLAWLAAY